MKRTCQRLTLLVFSLSMVLVANDANATINLGTLTNLTQLAKVEPGVSPETLTYANRDIVTFRATVAGQKPLTRLMNASAKIKDRILRGQDVDAGFAGTPDGIYFVALGDTPVFTVTPLDLTPEQAENPNKALREVAHQLDEAIDVWKNRNNPRILLHGTIFSLMGLLAFGLGIFLLWRTEERIVNRIAKKSRLIVDGVDIVETSGLHQVAARLIRYCTIIISAIFTYHVVTYCLRQFPLTLPLGVVLRDFLRSIAAQFARAFIKALPGMFIAAIIFFITRMVTRMVRAVLQSIAIRQRGKDTAIAETAAPTARIATILIWMFAVVIAYPYLPGSQSLAFKGLSVFTGLILSLGASGLVNQAMGGLVVMYSRALRVGDWIQTGTVEGMVTQLGMLSTKVRTPRNEEITIPNAVLVTTQINNFTRVDKNKGMIIFTDVTIGYDTPWRQVEAMLKEAAARTELIREKPAPIVLQTSLSDYYVEYRLQCYMDKPLKKPAVLSELHGHIQDVFNEYGVQIMSPHYIDDPDAPIVVPKEKWHEAPAKKSQEKK